MTTKEAMTLLARLATAFPARALEEHTSAIYLEYLIPLPYERTRLAAERLVMTATFFPTIAELLEAAGVTDDDSRNQLLKAMAGKLPLVRDAASVTGWAVGRAQLPPAALERMNAAQAQAALPAGPIVGEDQRRGLRERLKALASGLTGAVLLVAVLTGCEPRQPATYVMRNGALERVMPTPAPTPTPWERFERRYRDAAGFGPIVYTVRDRETGECWVYFGDVYRGSSAPASPEVCR